MKSNTTLEELLKKQAKLKQLIKKETKKAEEKTKQIYTQKCIIVGSLILEYINNNGEFSKQILNILDSSIKSEDEKELLGLKTLTDSQSETKT
jgi:hypothetical protein